MRTASLNLIAITIFSLTLLAILGPLLQIPATVPATLTFGILVMAAVDTFQWQGQGSALLVDWLAGVSPQRQERILHHEAGHFLIAYLLDIPVSGYALTAWEAFRQGQAAQGGVRFCDQELMEQLDQGKLSTQLVNRYCTLWMAGISAELITYGNAEGGIEDRGKIKALWRQLGRSEAMAKQQENWAILQAQTLLERHQRSYQALVNAMKQRLSVPECYQVIEQELIEQ